MQILKKLKSIFGRDSGAQTDGQQNETGVTVEREPGGSIDRSPPVSASSSEKAADEAEITEGDETIADQQDDDVKTDDAVTESEVTPDVEIEADEPDEEIEADEPTDDESTEPVDTISGIGPSYAERLSEAGVDSVNDLLNADISELASETGISEKRLQGWIDQVTDE